MLVAERWQKILALVNERGSIRVTELSELCGVTEETIRRDLDKLESEGRLMRSHGGAVRVGESQPEIPFKERETVHADLKRSIAREAVKHIRENDRIILDASTTAWYMAQILPDEPLTVLTNSIQVAVELSSKEKIQVVSTGGRLLPQSLSYAGPLAERSLDTYHVDKAFLSCKGVHTARGISESSELQALVKAKMVAISDEVFLLADHSKFGQQSFAHVASWERIGHVITDSSTSADSLEALREKGVKVTRLT
ncbi:DeoR/GlpR transcriptional regulator [Paenibacillus chitinolyticus]|uniref:DeoR/GlpR family DNA-binding transcription regulator n=1 Tax=Paenibacillus chitinolyticus TaxID=79263 RepID=A0A410WSD7_9BACL|nr:DeoR/GlpR family DNA-binding transcription regulator [Paenibacillus chitinolyticus]MCY9591211.1 DeoR/GlpR family DNA-binding transcription regulator [Paenibacillus chitinolyticus]MCY9595606.1 DeoR/GlpR family DNA-binding transcription regulator [Paenibacillus chitinolyticus]QAV17366.1 DeoR/GlpR transcriptional regulator [Paenibacillus chitinolyticus]